MIPAFFFTIKMTYGPFSHQVTVRGRHVTPLEADTCDDGDFQEVHHGWKMGHEGHILRMDRFIV